MNPHFPFADAAWFRLAIVGAEILAVVVVVRLWAAVADWWHATHWNTVGARLAPARPRRH
jgi:hypothetical protein